MSDLTRAEIEEFWESWLAVNREAERIGNWRIMAEHYAVDASSTAGTTTTRRRSSTRRTA